VKELEGIHGRPSATTLLHGLVALTGGVLIAAAAHYAERTGRKIAFQYVVVPGLNDTEEQATQLATLTKRLPCMVNLIPQNPLDEGEKPDDRAAARFGRRLRGRGVAAVVRRSRGAEVLGACGQLGGRAEL